MKIPAKGTGPRYCKRCNRYINDAIREQVEAHEPCPDGECTFRKEIEKAIKEAEQKPKFTIKPYVKPPVTFKIKPL